MSDPHAFRVDLEPLEGFRFNIRFDHDYDTQLVLDEPEPIGSGKGPNASRILAAAVANCLTASLLFCLKRSRIEAEGIRSSVSGTLTRGERGRLRIEGLKVRIDVPKEIEAERSALNRCLGLFEDFCVVTASVRQGIPIDVEVFGASGERLEAPRGD